MMKRRSSTSGRQSSNNGRRHRLRDSLSSIGGGFMDFEPDLLVASLLSLHDDDNNGVPRAKIARRHSCCTGSLQQVQNKRKHYAANAKKPSSCLFLNKSSSALIRQDDKLPEGSKTIQSVSLQSQPSPPPLLPSLTESFTCSSFSAKEEDEEDIKVGNITTTGDYRDDGDERNLEHVREDIERVDEDDDDGTTTTNHADTVTLACTIAGVIGSGMVANIAFEKLNTISPGCGSVFTLLQYVCVVAEKAPVALDKYIPPTIIPWHIHVACVVFMFGAVTWGNQCLAFDLPFAQYLVIKNSSPVFTMMLGYGFLHKRYNLGQMVSVLLISAGVILAVLSQQQQQQQQENDNHTTSQTANSTVMMGALLCAASSLSMACLGCIQEYALATYGKNSEPGAGSAEILFYTHLLGLPFFFLSGSDSGSGMMLSIHWTTLAAQWTTALPWGILNVLAVVCCKRCFFALLDNSSSLTATLVITMYRFLGIVNSACFMSNTNDDIHDNPRPNANFWWGALAVATGTVSYIVASTSSSGGVTALIEPDQKIKKS